MTIFLRKEPRDEIIVMEPKHLKMYILVKESLPSHKSVAVAHASLQCFLYYTYKKGHTENGRMMREWELYSFRKVVCEVSDEEFEKAKQLLPPSDFVVVTESAFDGAEVALAFCPRPDWPEAFRAFRLAKW